MYQPRFIRGNKRTILMRDVDREGVVLGWGVEGIQDMLCFPLYFAINLKSLKKKKKPKSIHKQQHWRSVQKEPEGPWHH